MRASRAWPGATLGVWAVKNPDIGHKTAHTHLEAVAEVQLRVGGRRGRHRLGRVLGDYLDEALRPKREMERRFFDLCASRGLPAPVTNVQRLGYELDCLWPDAGLGVELDGGAFHHTVRAYHADRRRDRELAVIGIQAIRVTWRDLEHDADALVADLRQLLADRMAAGGL